MYVGVYPPHQYMPEIFHFCFVINCFELKEKNFRSRGIQPNHISSFLYTLKMSETISDTIFLCLRDKQYYTCLTLQPNVQNLSLFQSLLCHTLFLSNFSQ